MVIAGAVGGIAGVAAGMMSTVAIDGMRRVLAYAGVVFLVAGAAALIKWRASLALIRKTELKIAP